ncbi:MAG: PTS transporter subunit EIIC [Micropruina glycogenica]
MFGLPAAALAIPRRQAQPEECPGHLSAAGLTAFITGITEPLEFAFMFVAFPLYVVHALPTGLSLAVAYALDIHLGFLVLGLMDLLALRRRLRPRNIPLLLVMGVVFFAVYYFLFLLRDRSGTCAPRVAKTTPTSKEQAANLTDGLAAGGGGVATAKAEQLIAAFGGRANLVNVDACITRPAWRSPTRARSTRPSCGLRRGRRGRGRQQRPSHLRHPGRRPQERHQQHLRPTRPDPIETVAALEEVALAAAVATVDV